LDVLYRGIGGGVFDLKCFFPALKFIFIGIFGHLNSGYGSYNGDSQPWFKNSLEEKVALS
jgi:hypothetical protein